MNVEANDLACVFGPRGEPGLVGRVLWRHSIKNTRCHQWIVRFKTIGEAIVADLHLMCLAVYPAKDPSARVLLDEAG